MPGEARGLGSRFLLDTNVLLVSLIEPERLPADIQELLVQTENAVLFSAASLWEIAIKSSLNRQDFDVDSEAIEQLALETGFQALPILGMHCHRVAYLPWHHRDPFDRLLIAQAESLPAILLTSDGLLSGYSSLVRLVALR